MKKTGFTLVEVLIVVIIIGILAAISLPQYTATVIRARTGEAFTNLGSLRASMDRYWYDQIAAGGYTPIIAGDTGPDSLDIDNPNSVPIANRKWTYNIDDRGDATSRSYVIRATYNADGSYWIEIDAPGTVSKSTNLGGTGVPL